MRKLAMIALGIAASLALVACGGDDNSTSAATSTPTTTQAGGGGAGETIKLAADANQIAYDTNSLSAKPGNVTIDFNNPSTALPHDVCVQSSSGGNLGCSEQVTNSSTTLSVSNLEPGKYTFYCSVDSHKAAGMEGTLSVK
jgi:plastocyanin